MFDPIGVPLLALLVLAILSAAALYHYLLAPGVAWLIRQRSQRVVGEVNSRLQLRLPQFSLTRRRILADRLAYDPKITELIEANAADTGTSVTVLRKRVARTAYEIVPAFNPYFYFRIGYWAARALLRSMYRVRLGYMDNEGLAQVGDDNAVVFCMNHRTNIDYVLATYMTATRSTMSYGVGEWARAWPIQPLMRAAGGYFLRRDSDDPLYRKVLERFIQMLTYERVPHALFVEGALSRDGQLQQPKLGMLGYITREFDPNLHPDIVFIPIGTNYDRVPEERTLIARASDSFINAGNFFILRSAVSFVAHMIALRFRRRTQPYGYACANYGSPISFSAWLRQHWLDWPSLERAEKFEWIARLADEIMGDVRQLIPILPVSIISAVYQHRIDEDFSEPELQELFDTAINEANANGGHVILPHADSAAGLQEALDLLLERKLLLRDPNGRLSVNSAERDLIQYYANSIIHFLPGLARGHA